jgi:hypothetical protein
MADGVAFVTGGTRAIGGAIALPRLPRPIPAATAATLLPRPRVPTLGARLLATSPPVLEATWPPHLADGCGRVGLAAALGPEGGRPATLPERTATVPRRLERGRMGTQATWRRGP